MFGFIRRKGYSDAEAQDLTQDFFVRILEGKLLDLADPERGRFRSLLLKSLKHFLIDGSIKKRRHKRGGAFEFIPWEEWDSNVTDWSHYNTPGGPDALFDVHWAAMIIEQAVRRLREECEATGYQRLYEVLYPYLDADRTEISYQHLASQLEIPLKSMKSLVHEFRKRFRTLLREEVAKTIENEADLDEEIRYLCSVLSSVAS